jgi:hypothetical protein
MVFKEIILHISVPHKCCPSHHLFYPLLGHEHSEQRYDTSDLLMLWMTFIMGLCILLRVLSRFVSKTFVAEDCFTYKPCYGWHPITNKLNPLNYWYDSLMHTKKNPYLIHDSHFSFCRKMCILVLVRCHCPPIWPPALLLYQTYILIVLVKLLLVNLPYSDF